MSTRRNVLIALAAAALGALLLIGLPWLLDSAPPTVRLGVVFPDAPTDGEPYLVGPAGIEWSYEADDPRGISEITLRVGDAAGIPLPLDGERWGNTLWPGEGLHEVVLEARDRSRRRNLGRSQPLRVLLDTTPPRVRLDGRASNARQGGTVGLLLAVDPDTVELKAEFLGRERKLHVVPEPGRDDRVLHRAIVGVPVDADSGPAPLRIRARDRAGNEAAVEASVEVEVYAFERGGFVRLSPTQEKAQKDRSKAEKANRKRSDAYDQAEADGQQRWSGPFTRPSAGRRSSPFGKFREYSSGVKRHHFGVDFASPLGTPIRAPAPGVVTLAESLHIYGNAVILDHGQGVSSSYNHLSRIDVAVGEAVDSGQVVGLVGSTGQSTGPHLHWGMVVDGVAVDAEQWTKQAWLPPEGEGSWIDTHPTPAPSG